MPRRVPGRRRRVRRVLEAKMVLGRAGAEEREVRSEGGKVVKEEVVNWGWRLVRGGIYGEICFWTHVVDEPEQADGEETGAVEAQD